MMVPDHIGDDAVTPKQGQEDQAMRALLKQVNRTLDVFDEAVRAALPANDAHATTKDRRRSEQGGPAT